MDDGFCSDHWFRCLSCGDTEGLSADDGWFTRIQSRFWQRAEIIGYTRVLYRHYERDWEESEESLAGVLRSWLDADPGLWRGGPLERDQLVDAMVFNAGLAMSIAHQIKSPKSTVFIEGLRARWSNVPVEACPHDAPVRGEWVDGWYYDNIMNVKIL